MAVKGVADGGHVRVVGDEYGQPDEGLQERGVRAVEQLRLNLAELQVATVRNQVALSLYTDFENFTSFKPGPQQPAAVNAMLDQLIAWGGALKPLRQPSEAAPA